MGMGYKHLHAEGGDAVRLADEDDVLDDRALDALARRVGARELRATADEGSWRGIRTYTGRGVEMPNVLMLNKAHTS